MSQSKAVCRRILSIGLAFVLAALLCACKDNTTKGGETGVVEEESTSSAAPAINANTVLAKEHVYRVSEAEIPDMEDELCLFRG